MRSNENWWDAYQSEGGDYDTLKIWERYSPRRSILKTHGEMSRSALHAIDSAQDLE